MTIQRNNNGMVHVFIARACAAPLEKAARLYEEKTGVHIEIDVCSRHCASPAAEEARRFMDFLASPESRAFYREYGWEVPAE